MHCWKHAYIGRLALWLTPFLPGAAASSPRSLDSLSGEVFLNNRKAKLVASYEVKITLGWRGTAADGTEATGMVELPVSRRWAVGGRGLHVPALGSAPSLALSQSLLGDFMKHTAAQWFDRLPPLRRQPQSSTSPTRTMTRTQRSRCSRWTTAGRPRSCATRSFGQAGARCGGRRPLHVTIWPAHMCFGAGALRPSWCRPGTNTDRCVVSPT